MYMLQNIRQLCYIIYSPFHAILNDFQIKTKHYHQSTTELS